ncbi:MAG: Mu transposase C-terminal domain-containing protein [Bacteroidales bacterium]
MTALHIPKGTRLDFKGVLYQVAGSPEGAIGHEFNLVEELSGRWVTLSAAEIAEALIDGKMRIRNPGLKPLSKAREEALSVPFDSHPPESQQFARRTYEYVRGYYEYPRRALSERCLTEVLMIVSARLGEPPPFGPKALSRWIRKYEEAGGSIRGLIPQFPKRGGKERKLPLEVLEIIEGVVHHVLSDTLVSVKDAHDMVVVQVNKLNKGRGPTEKLPLPSQRAIRREFKKLSGRTLAEWKRGERQAKLEFDPVFRGPRPKRPLEEVEIDHCLLDEHIVDEVYRIRIGRPWLTLAIDRATAMPLGVYITFAPPSYRSVMMCLRNAMMPKTGLRARYPALMHDWNAHGVMETIYIDNGREFHSQALDDACAELGVNIVYCPARQPWFKGRVERFFGTMGRDLIHKLPGTTFSNPKERGDYDSEGEATLTLRQLEELVHRWLIDVYANSEHRGIKDVPSCKWRDLTRMHPVRPASYDQLQVLMSQVEYRTISRKGIEFKGLLYNSHDLAALRERANEETRLYKLKIDPENLSYLYVEDPERKTYIKVPSIDPAYTNGLTLRQHDIVANYVRGQTKRRVNISELAEARVNLMRAVKQMAASNRKLTRKGNALLDDGAPVAGKPRSGPQQPASTQPTYRAVDPWIDSGSLLDDFEAAHGIQMEEF